MFKKIDKIFISIWIFMFIIAIILFAVLHEPKCPAKIVAGYWDGEFVCININNMDFDRALEVCQHEIGHEIFAELCEDNWTKCARVFRE